MLVIANIIGWVVLNKRLVAYIAGFLVLALVIIFVWRACRPGPPKLDEKQIQKYEQAVKERNDKALKEILAESDVRVQGIDNSIKASEEATEKAKRSYEGWSTDELAAELERRKGE